MIKAESSIHETDERLLAMEIHLSGIYTRAGREMSEKSRRYFSQFESADAKKRKEVDAGKLDADEYKEWRKNKLLYGRRYADFQRTITHELAVVNQTAISYINGETPEVFALNYNDMGTNITDAVNDQFRAGVSFDLVNADTVRLLASEDRELLPFKKLDETKDTRWNAKNIQSELLQGIIQGESIPKIAARMENVVGMNRDSAVRNARSMVTGAQNAGRMESMRHCQNELGIVTRKYWMSSDTPGRTRDWHMPGAFDSLEVDTEEVFHNALGNIMYPGDPAAAPANVYNCRCRLGVNVIGFIDPDTGKLKKINYPKL